MNVYEKLQNARVELQNEKLKKSGKNKYSGFTYYELSDFIPAVNQIFSDLKLFSNFSIKENIAYLEVINSEKPDETTTFTMPTTDLELKGCTKIQALGGVNTYCRRYLYLNALEIVESDMLDAKAGEITEEPKKPKVQEKPKPKAESKKQEPKLTKEQEEYDATVFDMVAACESENELVNVWLDHAKKVSDSELLKNLCASRKEVLLKGAKQ